MRQRSRMVSGAGRLRLVAVAPSVNPSASRSTYFSPFSSTPPSGAWLLRRRHSFRSLLFPCPLPRFVGFPSGGRSRFSSAAMSSFLSTYEEELAAAKKAASLASHLCQVLILSSSSLNGYFCSAEFIG